MILFEQSILRGGNLKGIQPRVNKVLYFLFNILKAVVFILAIQTAVAAGYANATDKSHEKEPILFFSGGAIDDFVTYTLLTTMEDIDFLGVVTTNADTIAGPAMDVQWKIANFLHDSNRPMALSQARAVNPFPYQYRDDCIAFGKIASLVQVAPNAAWPPYPSGEKLIYDTLKQAVDNNQPVTMLVTCPITALTDVLVKSPELEKGVRKIVFMGGAIDVPGNLDPNTIPPEIANQKAEWNIFWDPFAVDWLFKNTSIPIILFPLDVTNHAKLGPLMPRLEQQGKAYEVSKLVYEGYSLVTGQPYYRMWNVMTASYIQRPDLFGPPVTTRLIAVTQGKKEGALIKQANGRVVEVVYTVRSLDDYYDYILAQLRR
jgi:purine nucleosidase